MAATIAKPNVKEAFNKLYQGITKEYDTLLQYISNPDIQDAELMPCLRELQECLTEFGKEKETLVHIILKIKWTERSPKTIRQYQSLVLSLLSAHTFYIKPGLVMIVKQFLPGGVTSDETEITADKIKSDTEHFLQLHTLLRAILQIIPMAPVVLIPLLTDFFPYYTKPSYVHESYVRNLLELVLYLPKYRANILELIIDRTTKLDVRCPRGELRRLELEIEDEDDAEVRMFHMEGVTTELQKAAKSLRKDTDKLDVVMEQMLSHIKETCQPQGQLDWTATRNLYRELLTVFDKTLLPTHDSNHVQFIMFYICSLHEALSEGFLDYLWKKVRNPNTQSIFRQAAVAYIESFVSRALFISINTVKAVLDLLVPWIHSYIKETAEMNSRADVKHHGPFYSVCQAVFYILIFRHTELFDMENGLEYCQGLNLQTIVTSRLNPLRFCLPTVVTTFASIARQHQMAFCDVIIEKNKRSFLPECQSGSSFQSSVTQINPLDSFFPYDPYLLPRSIAYIEPLYREYSGAQVQQLDSSPLDQEEEEYMDVGSLGAKIMNSCSPSISMAKSPGSPSLVDFLLFGPSPGFKQP